jgi:hypothetical protein
VATATVRKPDRDNPEAPFGRDEKGQPIAPFGWLDEGTDKQRPRMYRVIRKDLPDLELDNLAAPLALPPKLVTATKPLQARSDKQAKLDGIVSASYAKWVKAGKPTTWQEMIDKKLIAGYWVAPDAVDGLKSLLDSSAAFHTQKGLAKMRVRYGNPADRDEEMEQDGRVFLPFVALDRGSREASESNGS